MMTTTERQTTGRALGELLDVRAVAELLSCSPRHVYRMADAWKMPRPIKLGQLVRWKLRGGPTDSIEGWIAAGCPTVRTARGAAQ